MKIFTRFHEISDNNRIIGQRFICQSGAKLQILSNLTNIPHSLHICFLFIHDLFHGFLNFIQRGLKLPPRYALAAKV